MKNSFEIITPKYETFQYFNEESWGVWIMIEGREPIVLGKHDKPLKFDSLKEAEEYIKQDLECQN